MLFHTNNAPPTKDAPIEKARKSRAKRCEQASTSRPQVSAGTRVMEAHTSFSSAPPNMPNAAGPFL